MRVRFSPLPPKLGEGMSREDLIDELKSAVYWDEESDMISDRAMLEYITLGIIELLGKNNEENS